MQTRKLITPFAVGGTAFLLVAMSGCSSSNYGTIRDNQAKAGVQTSVLPPNTLSQSERAAGWRLLWDGQTTAGWRSARSENFPANGWSLAGGVLTVHGAEGDESQRGGDIVTRERFSSFELLVDFKITPGANSGIKYFIQSEIGPNGKPGPNPTIGYEFQILDDERHPDAKLGRDGNRTLGSLYDLLPPATDKRVSPMGQWNTARIVVRGNQIEHWLNGRKILAYDRKSAAFRACVAQSKFKNISNFTEWPDGHILLQEHSSTVHFRNIKIRTLPAGPG